MSQFESLSLDKSFFKNYWFLVCIIFLIQTGIFVALSYEQFLVLGLVLIFVLFVYLIFSKKNYPLILIALIPLSQAIPIKSGGKETGLFPDYILIPFFFFMLINKKILKGDYKFLKTGLVSPGILFLIIATFSTIFAMTKFGLSKSVPGVGTAFAFTLTLMFFLLILDYLNDESQVKKLFFYFILSSLLMSSVGIIQYLMVSKNLLGIYRILSLFDNVLSKRSTGNANSLGTYLMFMTIIAISFRSFYSNWKKIIIYITIIANITAIILTASRSSLIALIVGIIIIGVIREKKMLLWLVPFSFGMVGAIIASPRMVRRMISIVDIVSDAQIFKIFSKLNLKSVNWSYIDYYGFAGYRSDIVAGAARFSAWINSANTFWEYPWLGIGLQMSIYYIKWPTAENYLLDILVWTGIFGFSIVCFIIYRLFKIAKGSIRKAKTHFEKTYSAMYFAILVSTCIVSMTGSVMFTLKLLLIFALLTALNCKIYLNNEQSK